MFTKVIFLSLVIFVLNGCVSKELSPLEDAKKHMLESEKLSLLVHELDQVVYNRLKSELERDNIRRRYALNLAETLKDLSDHLESISNDKLGTIVDKKDVDVYKQYAKKLYINSQEIHNIAQKYELEKLPSKLVEMLAFCNACHTEIRGY